MLPKEGHFPFQVIIACRQQLQIDQVRRPPESRYIESFEPKDDNAMQALEELDYPERLCKLLLAPQRIIRSELVITLDTGEIAAFEAWRVQHDNSRGPFKGGFRFHPNSNLDDARRFEAVSSFRTQAEPIHQHLDHSPSTLKAIQILYLFKSP